MTEDLGQFSLSDLFRGEAESQLKTIVDGLLALERAETEAQDTTADPASLHEVMRAAHSLKGAARVVGLDEVESVAHALEDRFVAAQKDPNGTAPAGIDAMLQAVDLLQELIALPESDWDAWREANAEHVKHALTNLKDAQAVPPAKSEPSSEGESTDRSVPEPAPEPATNDHSKPDTDPKANKPPSVQKPTDRPIADGPDALTPAVRSDPTRPGPRHPEELTQSASSSSATPTARPSAPSTTNAEPSERVVRVSADHLTRLLALAGEALVETRRLRPLIDELAGLRIRYHDLNRKVDSLHRRIAESHACGRVEIAGIQEIRTQTPQLQQSFHQQIERLEGLARRTEDLNERLHHEVIASRLRPLADGIQGFPRLVRDLARTTGKTVRFEVDGEQTGVDRDILEKLEAPLNHLIRNAIDHGVESPEGRRVADKPESATVRLEARHVAGMLQVSLSDDGRGLDTEAIRRRVVQRGLVQEAVAERLVEHELLEFLFLPGFSTRDQVTPVSGRGVGLDVVRTMVQTVGGTIRVSTTLGRGTTFSLLLPITRSVIRALLVEVSGEPYAFPLSRLDHVLEVEPDQIEYVEGRPVLAYDDQTLGIVPAWEVLGRSTPPSPDQRCPVVVVSDRGSCYGVIVDRIAGELDLDIRPLDRRLGRVADIQGASILPDGRPILILDVEDLVRSVDNLMHDRRPQITSATSKSRDRDKTRRILVVDDSITVRELERQLLESRGFEVDVAVDGMDGWDAVRQRSYDLVVSDIDMPRMDGIELVTRIKADPDLAAIPVVIVSYKDRQEDRVRGLEAGASFYLTKSSFHDQTFLESIQDLIGDGDHP